ncbi:MAG: DUF1761 domain-containing protein [Saprospiraceae bacterium]|nr:DUF1761 domain-containing protein [Saprospiraceae bacterium]
MHLNWLVIIGSALIPLLTGFVWYNPKTFGTIWMKASGVTEEQGKNANMPLIFGLTILFGIFIALAMVTVVIHQTHYYSLFANDASMRDPNSALSKSIQAFMDINGQNFRTFKHGSFHGALTGLLFAMPVLGVSALFEGKGRNYILVNTGYWVLTLALMGGVICAFA